jgi:hypothetical protein
MRYAASSSDKPSGGYELVDEFYDAAVSGADAERGIVNEHGVPFSAASIASMLGARRPLASISAPI